MLTNLFQNIGKNLGCLMKIDIVAHIAQMLYGGVYFGLRLIGRAIAILAEYTPTTQTNDKLNSAIRGGVMNYRTGKLDDSTDPYGWYEDD